MPGSRRSRRSSAQLQLEPVHLPFRAIFADGLTVAVMDGVATRTQLRELERRFMAFLRAIAAATGVDGDPAPIAAELRDRAERAFVGMAISEEDADFATVAAALAAGTPLDPEDIEHDPERRHGLDRRDRAALLAWMALSHTGALAPGADVAATSLAWYDELRLPSALVGGLHDTGFGEGEAWAVTDQVRVLLALPRPSAMRGSARVAAGRLFEAWLALELTRVAIGVNTWEGVEYLDRDRFLALLGWAVRLDAIDAADAKTARSSARIATRLAEAAETAGYRVDATRAALAVAAGSATAARADDARHGTAAPIVARAPTAYPSRIRRRSEVGGAPWAITDSRCGR